MKRIHHLLIGTAVLAVTATVFAQRRANELPTVPNAFGDLLAKVERLEDQVARLETEVRSLRARRNVITTPVPAVPGRPLPRGWQEGTFNGLPYYLIPCDEKGTATTGPAR